MIEKRARPRADNLRLQGLRYPKDKIDWMLDAARLKKATDLGDCADAFVMIAKNASMTGQQIQVGTSA